MRTERESRRARAREMFVRIAGFPAIKTLDQYDFNFATRAWRADGVRAHEGKRLGEAILKMVKFNIAELQSAVKDEPSWVGRVTLLDTSAFGEHVVYDN